MTSASAGQRRIESGQADDEFIRHHRLQKGDRLPSERELSDRFGVTRGSVREALAVLDALRLTERRPKSGIFLRNALEDSGLDSLVVQANLDLPFDERTMRDVSEARVIFETHAIGLACARRTNADLDRLRELVANYSGRVQAELNVADQDVEFHLAMAAASQNAIIVRTLTPLFLMSFQWRRKYFSSPVIRRRSLADHQEFHCRHRQQRHYPRGGSGAKACPFGVRRSSGTGGRRCAAGLSPSTERARSSRCCRDTGRMQRKSKPISIRSN